MSEKAKFIRLEYVGGSSSKFYEVWLEATGGGYHKVMFQYGRIGTPGVMGTKTPNALMESHATKIYNDLIYEKEAKGYEKTGTKKQPIALMPLGILPKKVTGLESVPTAGMMPTAVHESDLDQYINSDEWFAQQKMNGKFIRVLKPKGGNVVAYNKLTKQTQLPELIHDALSGYHESLAIDGELIGDVYHAFDLTHAGGVDIAGTSAEDRHGRLLKVRNMISSKHFSVVEAYHTTSEKASFVASMKNTNQEGVVFKKGAAAYLPGKTENLGVAVCIKVKFWKEVSAYVLAWNDKNSIQLALAGKGSTMVGNKKDLVECGNVTVPEKHKSKIKPGRIVRVKYLYATSGGILYQPSLDPDDDGDVVRMDADWPDKVTLLKFEGVADAPKFKRNIIV